MNVTVKTLSAILRIAKNFALSDGQVKDEELAPIFDFFQTFPDITKEQLDLIIEHSDELSDIQALHLIYELDEDGKQQMSNLFAKIVCADSTLEDDEKALFFQVRDLCGLPDPEDEEESKPAEPEQTEDNDSIVPAFIVATFQGIASVKQSEHEDWNTLGGELASWIGADRVEIVRFTPALNAISEKLRLNERHLVFMVDRNGMNSTAGDNMPATLLYGRGYPIYGNIVFALETDKGYEIEGFITKSLLNEAFGAINEAVDGLLRVAE